MLRFFSKMRYKLATENRAAKYLRYAIGEILLVVIGILIALQVNNWNETRKLQNEKYKLLIALKQEFLTNKKNLEEILNGKKTSNYFFTKVLNFSAGSTPELPIDSLRLFTSKMIFPLKLSLLTSVQEEAVSSGKFELLPDNLKLMLSQFKDFINSFNSIDSNSDYFLTNDNKMNESLLKLSIYDTLYKNVFPNRPVSIHPAFKMKDPELVTFIQLPQTYTMLYKIYFTEITNELWLDVGLSFQTNNILEEINKEIQYMAEKYD